MLILLILFLGKNLNVNMFTNIASTTSDTPIITEISVDKESITTANYGIA